MSSSKPPKPDGKWKLNALGEWIKWNHVKALEFGAKTTLSGLVEYTWPKPRLGANVEPDGWSVLVKAHNADLPDKEALIESGYSAAEADSKVDRHAKALKDLKSRAKEACSDLFLSVDSRLVKKTKALRPEVLETLRNPDRVLEQEEGEEEPVKDVDGLPCKVDDDPQLLVMAIWYVLSNETHMAEFRCQARENLQHFRGHPTDMTMLNAQFLQETELALVTGVKLEGYDILRAYLRSMALDHKELYQTVSNNMMPDDKVLAAADDEARRFPPTPWSAVGLHNWLHELMDKVVKKNVELTVMDYDRARSLGDHGRAETTASFTDGSQDGGNPWNGNKRHQNSPPSQGKTKPRGEPAKPSGDTTRRDKPKQCGNCKSKDHYFSQCPTVVCNKCSQKGHIASHCKEKE
jgi:hypothetical protein